MAKVLLKGSERAAVRGARVLAPADPAERLEVSVWAALIARINQSTGKVAGYINPRLYQNPQALRDVTQGGNGDFTAQISWDACTGLGSPNGKALASII